nr:MAG TPA: hypothetical protein [Caudoviricetes sp.]
MFSDISSCHYISALLLTVHDIIIEKKDVPYG